MCPGCSTTFMCAHAFKEHLRKSFENCGLSGEYKKDLILKTEKELSDLTDLVISAQTLLSLKKQ